MSDPFIAEIRMFGGTFAPVNWALCNGQLMAISQNTALFSLLGTSYGGDGRTTFGLPNFQGTVPIGAGQGAGLSQYVVGQTGGSPTVTLLSAGMAVHTHPLRGNFNTADVNAPSPVRSLARSGTGFLYQSGTTANLTNMAAEALPPAGGSQPHNNLQPFRTVMFIIAMHGLFPPRS
jgi:microcystin-dependent protein